MWSLIFASFVIEVFFLQTCLQMRVRVNLGKIKKTINKIICKKFFLWLLFFSSIIAGKNPVKSCKEPSVGRFCRMLMLLIIYSLITNPFKSSYYFLWDLCWSNAEFDLMCAAKLIWSKWLSIFFFLIKLCWHQMGTES